MFNIVINFILFYFLFSGLNSLRFYLATDLKDRISNDSKSNIKIFSSPEKTVTNYVVASSTKSLFDVSPSNSPTSLWLSNNDNFENIFDGYNNLDESLKNEERITDVYVEQQIHNNLIDHNYYTVPEPLEEKTKLILHRGRIFNELIEAFKHIKMYPQFQFELILPNGSVENAIDVGGVFKDVLAEFWSSFYEMATTGCNWKIPIIRHDFQDEQWRAIGKIIFIGWRDIQYLPLSLALPFMEYVICGTVVNNQYLVDGFLNTLPFKSKDILQNALKDFKQIDEDELLDILQEFDCRLVVNEKNIKDVVSEIAHKEIIQRPKYIIDIWSEELRNKVIPIISKISLQEMYINNVPTSTNLLKNLQCPDKDDSEIKRKVFGFLKKFIREADQMLCTKFLRFVTGSDIITDYININFTSAKDNYSRSPVAHTCTNTLDLPMSYDRFIDLRSEINSILASNVWVMDIA